MGEEGYRLDPYDELARDLEIVRFWNCRIHDRLPLLYNNFLSTGYFQTPSARMASNGMVSMGMAWAEPYLHASLNVQLFPFLEAGLSYRFFLHLRDPILSPHGFGVRSDKEASLKLQIWNPMAHGIFLPDLAIGVVDFTGNNLFFSYYGVATQSFLRWNLEASFGWSFGRMRGPFGAVAWSPLRQLPSPWVKGLSLVAEYDSIQYKKRRFEPHPLARKQSCKVNYGIKYQVCNYWDLSVARLRGEETSAAFSLHMNLAETDGWLPKLLDPAYYSAPQILEPIGPYRPEEAMIQDMVHSFSCQGFCLQHAWLSTHPDGRETLWIDLSNNCWRCESLTRKRIQCLLAALTPSNIDRVRVRVSVMNLPSQQYTFRTRDLRHYGAQSISEWEMEILAPMQNASSPPLCAKTLFCHPKPRFCPAVKPFGRIFLGGSTGKLKYALGGEATLVGELPCGVIYQGAVAYTALSTLKEIGSIDLISPSQIINVRSDSVLYFQENNLTFPVLFIQKNLYLSKSLYSRISLGYFEPAYGGAAGELLWSPATCPLAIGLQGALFKKRNYSGLGFQKTVRKLDGFRPTQLNYTFLSQYFVDFYYKFERACLIFQLSFGGYLAKDHGGTLKVTRYYRSGLKLYGWYTLTNFSDEVHGDRYNDFGVGFTLPLDLFLPKSCRHDFGRAMSAWLRDIGATAYTGYPLYPSLYAERE